MRKRRNPPAAPWPPLRAVFCCSPPFPAPPPLHVGSGSREYPTPHLLTPVRPPPGRCCLSALLPAPAAPGCWDSTLPDPDGSGASAGDLCSRESCPPCPPLCRPGCRACLELGCWSGSAPCFLLPPGRPRSPGHPWGQSRCEPAPAAAARCCAPAPPCSAPCCRQAGRRPAARGRWASSRCA